jgi:hypothetical protein
MPALPGLTDHELAGPPNLGPTDGGESFDETSEGVA